MKILENVSFVKHEVEFKGEVYHYGLKFNNWDGDRKIVPVSDNLTVKDIVENVEAFLKNMEFSDAYCSDRKERSIDELLKIFGDNNANGK